MSTIALFGAAAGLVIIMTLITVNYGERTVLLNLASNVAWSAAAVFVMLRFGYVALITGWAVSSMAEAFPWSTDFGAWFAPQLILGWALLLALLVYGFTTAIRGKSLFSDPLSDPVIGGKHLAR